MEKWWLGEQAYLIEGVADVEAAIGVWRSIVQCKRGTASTLEAALVRVALGPPRLYRRLTRDGIGAQGEFGGREIHSASIRRLFRLFLLAASALAPARGAYLHQARTSSTPPDAACSHGSCIARCVQCAHGWRSAEEGSRVCPQEARTQAQRFASWRARTFY